MHRYIPNSEQDKKDMLKAIDKQSIGDLFTDIPEKFRLDRDLNLDPSKSELEVDRL